MLSRRHLPDQAQQISFSSSRLHQAASSKRYHPYMAHARRCQDPVDSISPSPFSMSYIHARIAPARVQLDYLSALPQELIEEIGLLTCVPPFTGDPSEPFFLERHQLRSLHALSLVSKQFHQIFAHRLYQEPLVIDTQDAPSSTRRNSAALWQNTLTYANGRLAKRFTLWRPPSDEAWTGKLRPVEPFGLLQMLCNLHELTLSGNFSDPFAKNDYYKSETSLTAVYVPNLSSVRIIDVDNAEAILTILYGIAPYIKTLVIRPSSTGQGDEVYNPLLVYSALHPIIKNLTALTSLTVSLPSVRINHCNHGYKLLQRSLLSLPYKDRLKHFTLTLPPFDCRSEQWADTSDSDDEGLDETGIVDHAWFWMTLQNHLSGCTELTTFTFTGSLASDQIRRKITAASPETTMSFVKAENRPPCHHRFNVHSFEITVPDLPSRSVPTQTQSYATPAPAAPVDPPATPFFPAHPHWTEFTGQSPETHPVDPISDDTWSEVPTYRYEQVPPQFSNVGVTTPPPFLPMFSEMHDDESLHESFLAIPFDYDQPFVSQSSQEPPPSQAYSVDSGFASQEYPVNSHFSSQNPLTAGEGHLSTSLSLPHWNAGEWSAPADVEFDYYIKYD